LTYEIMAYRAGQRQSKCKRTAKNGLKQRETELPQHCVSQLLIDKVSMISFETELNFSKELFNTTMNSDSRFTEIKDAVNKSYCSVDISKVLKDKKWQYLFS